MPKQKTHSGAKKRFKLTKNGMVKYQKTNRRHRPVASVGLLVLYHTVLGELKTLFSARMSLLLWHNISSFDLDRKTVPNIYFEALGETNITRERPSILPGFSTVPDRKSVV